MSTPSDQPPVAAGPTGAAGPTHADSHPRDAVTGSAAATGVSDAAPSVRPAAPAAGHPAARLPAWLALAAAVVAVAAIVVAWQARERLLRLEAELVRRQQASADAVAEARLSARQAQELARETAARASLQELRLVELTAARDQVEDVLKAVTRSRDDNLLAEVDAGLRIAMHQAAITGSADAVLLTLRYAEDRLGRASGPAIDRVRRAVTADLERVKAGSPVDPTALAERLDEALRDVDSLPLLAQPLTPAAAASVPERRRAERQPAASPAPASDASAAPPADADAGTAVWRARVAAWWDHVWAEVRSLVRLTPIDHPEAALLAPEQAVFLRENLRLRLLGARVALLSRRFDSAQQDIAAARGLLERYFDRGSRQVQAALEALRQIGAQARSSPVPRPEATLSAIAAATGGR